MIRFAVNQSVGKKPGQSFWRRALAEIEIVAGRELKTQLKRQGIALKNSEISLALVGDAAMRRLNRIYRGKDQVTDVLSFGAHDQAKNFRFCGPEYLGEIIIAYPQARRQAKIAKHSLDSELSLLLTHGFLHLLGLDHEKSKKDAQLMEKLQAKIVKSK